MPYLGDPNIHITRWNDSTPKQFEHCEVDRFRFGCEHENIHMYRCKEHCEMPKQDIPGKNYCAGELRPVDGVKRESVQPASSREQDPV